MRITHKDLISNHTITEDILFDSSSAVAAFVAGSNRNGKICWKDANGILLKDLLERGEY